MSVIPGDVQYSQIFRLGCVIVISPAWFPPDVGPSVHELAVESQLLEGDAEEAVGLVAPPAPAEDNHLVVDAGTALLEIWVKLVSLFHVKDMKMNLSELQISRLK